VDFSANLKAHVERRGMLIVLSGPSGVGKDTLLPKLEELCPHLERCVTYTTRAPRPMEVPGKDYNFISRPEFQKMIDEGDFLEYAQVHLDLYGSPLSPVVRIREQGLDAILKIDVQGGLTVKQKVPDAIMIFIAPPSLEELERRLRSRYTDSEAAITKRLSDARTEVAEIPKYDYLVVNDDVDTAVDKLRCIVLAERAKIVGWG
jgi:guanylate kinase